MKHLFLSLFLLHVSGSAGVLSDFKRERVFNLSPALLEEYYIEFLRDMCDRYEMLPPMNEREVQEAFLLWLFFHIKRSDVLKAERYTVVADDEKMRA